MPKVTVNMVNLKKGTNVTVPGLGTFENDSTTEVSKAVVDRFVASKPSAKDVVSGDEVLITNAIEKPAKKASTKKSKEEEVEPKSDEDVVEVNVTKEESDD